MFSLILYISSRYSQSCTLPSRSRLPLAQRELKFDSSFAAKPWTGTKDYKLPKTSILGATDSLLSALHYPSVVAATVPGTGFTHRHPARCPASQLIVKNISFIYLCTSPRSSPAFLAIAALHLAQNFGIACLGGLIFGCSFTLSRVTVLRFNIPYVIFNVGPKLRQLDPTCTLWRWIWAVHRGKPSSKVIIIPQLSPASVLICLTTPLMTSPFQSSAR